MSKKIFRKYRSVSSKNHIRPLLGSLLILVLDLLIVTAFLWLYTNLTSFSLAIFKPTPIRILIFLGLVCCFFLILLILCIFSLNSEPVYTLVLADSTLHYVDDAGSYDLKIPCMLERSADTILLSDGTIKIFIRYDENKDSDLLEFLKDVIN